MRLFIILSIAIFFTGCADSHHLMRTTSASVKLDPSVRMYISVPRDGKYGQINYQGSGVNTSQIILLELSKHNVSAETGFEYQSFKDAITYAKNNNYGYLVFPTILEWEDRATEWSGIPDKASINIAIVNVNTGKTIDSAIIKGKSGLATFGGDHPNIWGQSKNHCLILITSLLVSMNNFYSDPKYLIIFTLTPNILTPNI